METRYEEEGLKERTREIEKSIIKRFRKEIWRPFVKALNEYEMIQEGDQIAVCISGGKDSMLLAKCMQEILRHGKMEFGLKFLVMDPGYREENRKLIHENARILGIPIHVFETEIFDTVVDVEDSPCYLCARMRRGNLYANARELGCNKIALGHHFDDVIETILMSMLYGAQINTMMPKLHSTNFQGMELIRPLYLVKEADILAWKEYNQLQFLQCACRFTEESSRRQNEELSKRKEMKKLIGEFRKTSPYIDMNIFRSMENVNTDACIGYIRRGERHHSWRNIKKDAIIHFCKAKALERCGGVFMMELVKKHIHMNRRSGSVASQMTLDDDFNVPDTMEDVEQLILERGEIQIESAKNQGEKVEVRGRLGFPGGCTGARRTGHDPGRKPSL